MNLEFGRAVRCTDGPPRELADVVVDARGRRVTHLVVEPPHRHEAARLVSVDLASETPEGISLGCTTEMLDHLDPVRGVAYLPAGEQPDEGADWDVGVEEVLVAPAVEPLDPLGAELDANVNLMYDRVPKGEVELRRVSSVYSSDERRLGSVRGVDVDRDGGIAALWLQRGHLWWRRSVAVPIESVASIENDLVTLAVTRRELDSLRR